MSPAKHRLKRQPPLNKKTTSITCLIVHPVFKQRSAVKSRSFERSLESELEEAEGLAHAISLEVLDLRAVNVYSMEPGTLFGKGACETLAETIEELEPTVVIVNFNLSPVQQRNLEKLWNVKVIDRTGLILEIFGERAATKEGKIQVDLAALNYQRSRLVKSWTHLERQRAGGGFLGGPGETQLELDRRMIDEKINRLKKQLIEVRRTRDLSRQNRLKVPFPIVALVGYTNAGKSTLFNTLTGADVFAEDLRFATLDPTLRRLKLPNAQMVIMSDTVGFIADLPTHLVEAFRATLEQVQYADVIMHVRDISSEDTDSQREDVIRVLSDLGIDYTADPRIIEVLNKIDLTDDERPRTYRDFKGPQIGISALKKKNLPALLKAAEDIVSIKRETVKISLNAGQGKALSWLYANAEIVKKQAKEDKLTLTVAIEPVDLKKFQSQFASAKVKAV